VKAIAVDAAAGSAIESIAELVARVHGTISRGFARVTVAGEISNLRLPSSGHAYFTLKDERAQIAAVLFRGAAAGSRIAPSDGLEVVARGRVAVYEPRGTLQIIVDRLEPRGLGALRQELERRRAKLAAEGLLDPERKRPLPFLPRCVGVVTARRGAAIHDVLVTLRARMPGLRIVLRPVRVQGIGAAAEIARGLRELQALADLDVVIVGRGGGSVEDLWAFNEEEVVRAIAASRVPVVSAVGHEIDVTLADLVADWRAATPTAAAERVVPRRRDLLERLGERERRLLAGTARIVERARRTLGATRARLRDPRHDVALAGSRARELRGRLERGARGRLEAARARVEVLEARLGRASPAPAVEHGRRAVARAERSLESCVTMHLRRGRERWAAAGGRLSSLSPLAVLERGYAVVWRAGDARALRSAAEVAVGDAIRARFACGSITARVEATESDGELLGRAPARVRARGDGE
jgi:exodeoxyribonuclease VII large subunit